MRATWIAPVCLLLAEGGPPGPTVKEVVVETADGLSLAADLHEPEGGGEGKPAVLALHDAGGDRKAWQRFGERLAAHGVSVLALDLRGHGANRTEAAEAADRPPDDPAAWKAMAADAEAGLKYLRATLLADGKRLGIAGAGAGAGLALTTAEKDEKVRAFLGVVPSPAACGQAGLAAAARWNGRPAGIVLGSADERGDAAPLAKALAKQPRTEVIVLPLEQKTGSAALLDLGRGAAEAAQFLYGWLLRPAFTGKDEQGVRRGGGIFDSGNGSGFGICAGGIEFNGYWAPGQISGLVVLADPDPRAKKLTTSSRRITATPAKAGKEPALSLTVETWSGSAWKKEKPFTAVDAGCFVVEGKTTFYQVWLPPSVLGVAPFTEVALQSAAIVDGETKWPDRREAGAFAGMGRDAPFSLTNPSSWHTMELR